MTGPAIASGTPDWLTLYGPQSEMFRQEQALFNQSRDAFLANILGRRQAGAADALTAQIHTQPQAWRDEDLVGAATYWGIPEQVARAMPRDQLIAQVDTYRKAARPTDAEASSFTSALAPLAMFGVGAAEAVTGGLGRLPFIGESLRKSQWLHAADMEMRQLEEGVRSSTPESLQGLESGANVAGNLATMWVPGGAAWKAAGVAGKVVPFAMLGGRVAPIARAAFQGGASAWMLEGGGQDFHEHPGMSLAAGATLGLVGKAVEAGITKFAPQIEALSNKVTRSFMPEQLLQPGDLSGVGTPEAAAFEHTPVEGPQLPDEIMNHLASQGDPQALEMQRYRQGQSDVAAQDQAAQSFWHGATDNGRARFLGVEPGQAPNIPWEGLTTEQQHAVKVNSGIIRAEDSAAQLNKAAQVIESPAFGEIAGRTQVDEVSAADGAYATNPGGSNVIQGISDPLKFASSMPGHTRFAQRGNRLDAMTSDRPIEDRMVQQYEKHGIYEGMRVLTADGTGGSVSSINGNYAIVTPTYHPDMPLVTTVDDLHPWTTSPAAEPVPHLWNQFNEYVNQRVGATADAMGNAISPAQLTTVRQSNLASYMEDFLDDVGISHTGDRARIKQYFNQQYVESFKSLAVPEMNFQKAAVQTANDFTPSACPI